MANPFENIRTNAGDKDRSFRWYQDAVRKLANNIDSYSGATRSDLGEFTNKLEPGNMYMYVYDPKFKDTLPYYDQFPLCLPFDDMTGGFVGLNLHYLPPLLRAKLLGELLNYTDKELSDKSKIEVSWSTLKSFSKFPGVQPTVKKYLYSQVNSRFLKIHPEHWKASIFLPTQNFVGASTQKVYRDSRDIING
tara:strand:+ start:492 stop:1067 length:576 start_codon:yes stop_codon:yes gene_type:complete